MGRQRLAAEATRQCSQQVTKRRLPVLVGRRMRLVPVLVSLLIVLTLLPFFAQEVAASLPGSPLYGLKILVQDVHLWATGGPGAHGDLDVSVAQRRLNDVAAALEEGHAVNDAAAGSAERQLDRAMQAVSQNPETAETAAPVQLIEAIQNCERVMVDALNQMSESEQRPLRELLHQMERAREELHQGAGAASGEQERARQGEPIEAEEIPVGPNQSDPQRRMQGQGPEGPDPGAPGRPAEAPKQQPAASGPAIGATPTATPTPTPPVAEPTPEQSQQPKDNGGQQQPAPGGNQPQNNSTSGSKGNNGGTGKP
jgi:hypothetical protein